MKFCLKSFSVLLVMLAVTLPAMAVEPVSQCDALAAWASRLEKLPADYESFSALGHGQRLAVYQHLSDADRAGLWQAQLQESLRLAELDPVRRALLVEAGRFATPANLSALRARSGAAFETADRQRRSLEERVLASFSIAEARQVFFQLGRPTEARGWLDCNCNVDPDSLPCPNGGTCRFGACTELIQGCGFMGWQSCDGLCRNP